MFTLLTIVAIISVVPAIWTIFTSFKGTQEIYSAFSFFSQNMSWNRIVTRISESGSYLRLGDSFINTVVMSVA